MFNYPKLVADHLGQKALKPNCNDYRLVIVFNNSPIIGRASSLIHAAGIKTVGELFEPNVKQQLLELPIREAGWMGLARRLVTYFPRDM